MPNTTIYDDLKKALQDFSAFLGANKQVIHDAIGPIKALVPAIGDLLTALIDLMSKLADKINQLDVGNIPGLAQVTEFTQDVQTLLGFVATILPDQSSTINDALGKAKVVGGLPGLGTVKQDIFGLINDVTATLKFIDS
jgi:hypothetical protein